MEGRLFKQFKQDCGSIKEYAYLEDRNYPQRTTMEDNHFAIDGFGKQKSTGLFAIFDGHGGSEVVDSCVTMVPDNFAKMYLKGKQNIPELFVNVFKKVDDQLKFVGASECGSTACVALIRENNGKKICSVANLGDTRAVLAYENGSHKRVTIDHKVTNPSEEQRVKKQGGAILRGRVAGQLAITRAFGDLQLKTEGVSCIPDLEQFQIEPKTKYLIIASDGLWDVCEDQKAVQLTSKASTTQQMCKILIEFALKNKSKDNISVLVLKFN